LKEQNTFLEDLFYSNISSNSKSQDEIEISHEDLNNEKVLNDKKNNQENSIKDKKEIDEILFFDKNEANYLKNKKKRKFEAKEIGSSSRQIKEITKKAKEDVIKEKCGFCNKTFLKNKFISTKRLSKWFWM